MHAIEAANAVEIDKSLGYIKKFVKLALKKLENDYTGPECIMHGSEASRIREARRASNTHDHGHAHAHAGAAAAAAREEMVELTSDEILPGLQRVEKKLLSLMESLGKKLLQLYPDHAEKASPAKVEGSVEGSAFSSFLG